MSRSKKIVEECNVKPLAAIRLVKATEIAARAVEVQAAPVPAKRLEFLRAPRGEAEARSMFETLFQAA